MAPCHCRVGAYTWREDGGGGSAGGVPGGRLTASGGWRLAAPGAMESGRDFVSSGWRLLARWRLKNWRLGDFVSATPGRDG
jgi:hypothetical protein